MRKKPNPANELLKQMQVRSKQQQLQHGTRSHGMTAAQQLNIGGVSISSDIRGGRSGVMLAGMKSERNLKTAAGRLSMRGSSSQPSLGGSSLNSSLNSIK